MRTWKQGILATAILMGMSFPIGVQAAGVSTAAQEENSQLLHTHGENIDHGHGGAHKMRHVRMGTHQKMYMILLAEKYTPNSVGEWQAAFKERDRLISEMKAAREASGERQKRQAKREEYQQLKTKLEEQVKKGKITSHQMEQQLKEWRDKAYGDRENTDDADRQAQMEQIRQTHEAFDAAIESADTAKIKEVLPKLLEQMKARNERLAKKLAETKK